LGSWFPSRSVALPGIVVLRLRRLSLRYAVKMRDTMQCKISVENAGLWREWRNRSGQHRDAIT
jgi:hypothetical protein